MPPASAGLAARFQQAAEVAPSSLLAPDPGQGHSHLQPLLSATTGASCLQQLQACSFHTRSLPRMVSCSAEANQGHLIFKRGLLGEERYALNAKDRIPAVSRGDVSGWGVFPGPHKSLHIGEHLCPLHLESSGLRLFFPSRKTAVPILCQALGYRLGVQG